MGHELRNTAPQGVSLHYACTARYFLDQVPPKNPQAHPFQTPLHHPCLRSRSHCRPWDTSFSGGKRGSIFHEWGWEDGPRVLGMAVQHGPAADPAADRLGMMAWCVLASTKDPWR